MSRLLVAAFAFSASAALAQQLSDAEIAAQIEAARRLVAVDENGCVKYPQDEEIVVCGENTDEKSQRAFRDRVPDENRIRPGEAVSQVRAACCSQFQKFRRSGRLRSATSRRQRFHWKKC